MADKPISELVSAEQILPADLFVLEQSGTAKKLTGQVLLNWLTKAADGHGGIQSYELVKTNGLVKTYRFTLADTTFMDIDVADGNGIESITHESTSGLVDTYKILYTSGSFALFTVTNGEKGDKGDNTYLWIKYASQEPSVNSHSFGDVPDDWIGIYFGSLSSAPSDWTMYTWFKIKGEKGDTGDPATLVSASVTYQSSDSGTIIPSGVWTESIPVVAQGRYLWTRTVQQFNTGDPITSYTVSRMGMDGLGSVVSVAGIGPDGNGNVPLTAEDVNALPIGGGDMTGPINMNGQSIDGLNAPTKDTEPATKGYVDGAFRPSNWLPTPEEIGAVSIELLWENASLDSTFEPQTISLNLSGYVAIYILFRTTNSSTTFVPGQLVPIDGKEYSFFDISRSSTSRFNRYVTPTSTGVIVGGGTKDGPSDNTVMIPYKIYGIKGVS